MKDVLAEIVKVLSPKISKKLILTQLDSTLIELEESTVPMIKSMVSRYEKKSFRSDEAKVFNDRFIRTYGKRFKGDSPYIIFKSLENIVINLKKLQTMIKRDFPNDLVRNAVGYDQAYILQYVQAAMFLSRYTRVLTVYLLNYEAEEYDILSGGKLSDRQMNYIRTDFNKYVGILTAASCTHKELGGALVAIGDGLVDVNGTGLGGVGNEGQLDPLGMNLYIHKFNIIYHLSVAWEDLLYDRVEEAKIRRVQVMYKLQELEAADAGKSLPNIAAAIESAQAQLDNLDYKIRKWEER